jgi:rhodanese-related sulfurtransferase
MTDRIDARTLKQWLHDGSEIAALDVREAGQFGEGHLFYAIPLPYSRLEIDVGRLVPRTGTRLVVIDDDGGTVGARAAQRLVALGYTNVHCLDGGCRAWAAAGLHLFKGVNLPSKTFGELVEHEYHTPRVTVTDLKGMLDRGEDVVVLDGRPYTEYQKMSIPTGICCPNGELPYRAEAIVKNPATRIVVNCAGRTRSIMGAQTLINFGIPNPVYALENGTQGWSLADFKLDHGQTRKYPDRPAGVDPAAQQARARALAAKHQVPFVDAATVAGWLADTARNVFLCDVRTPEEFDRGSLPLAQHTPGGQLLQSTDQYVGVRGAKIVVFDAEGVRAPTTAAWLAQMGLDVAVLEGSVAAGTAAKLRGVRGPAPRYPDVRAIAPGEMRAILGRGDGTVIDVGSSMRFRKSHLDGAVWSIRPRVLLKAGRTGITTALFADEAAVAKLAAIDLLEAGVADVRIVDGSLAACESAGFPLVASPGAPPDDECIDYLFFVHDRHDGNRAAMRQYLAWETDLLNQIDAQERAAYRIPARHQA